MDAHGERLLKVLHPATRALLGQEEEDRMEGRRRHKRRRQPPPAPQPPPQPHEPEVIDVPDSD